MKRAKEGNMRKSAGAVSGTAIGKEKVGCSFIDVDFCLEV